MTNAPRILLILGVLLILLGIGIVYIPNKPQTAEETPTVDQQHPDWLTYEDASLSFRYPESLDLTYVHPQEWPPRISVVEGQASCEETITLNGHTYCRTLETEGAAGSIYIDYLYTLQKGDRYLSLAFTLRTPQCANYDDPQKTACEQEQHSFNPSELADQILQSVELK